MDVLAVYQSVTDAVKLVKERSKPSLLEIKTYRYLGHSMSDPATYRTKEEVAKYKSQDPIIILRDKMTLAGLITEDEYVVMDKDCKSIVAEAIEFAEQSKPPEIETLYEDVLAE
jgi:pyruvate dehydrogenase E1 component alpha subunit